MKFKTKRQRERSLEQIAGCYYVAKPEVDAYIRRYGNTEFIIEYNEEHCPEWLDQIQSGNYEKESLQ